MNDCLVGGETASIANGCDLGDLSGTTISTAYNRFFTLGGADPPRMIRCSGKGYSLAEWQHLVASNGLGKIGESGSSVHPMPTVDVTLAMARERLGLLYR